MNRHAFTLIELVVVMMLIGILAAVAIPRFGSSVARSTGHSAAERIAADIAYVQAEAVRRQQERTIRFNVGLNKINWSFAGAGEDIMDPNHPNEKYIVVLNEDMPGVSLVSANFNGQDQLTFDLYGVPSEPGDVVIASGDQQWTISVDAGTGRTQITE